MVPGGFLSTGGTDGRVEWLSHTAPLGCRPDLPPSAHSIYSWARRQYIWRCVCSMCPGTSRRFECPSTVVTRRRRRLLRDGRRSSPPALGVVNCDNGANV